MLETISIDYISRYIQQTVKNWQPTLFRYERWNVEFLNGYKTSRNIRYIQLNNPRDNYRYNDLQQNITYNNKEGSYKHESINMNFSKIIEVKHLKDDYGDSL